MSSIPAPHLERPLEPYLASVARGLWAVGVSRRREIVRTLRADLLDLVQGRGLQEEAQIKGFLEEQTPPRKLASILQAGELQRAYLRVAVALLPMFIAGLWTLLFHAERSNVPMIWLVRKVAWYSSMTYLQFALRGIWAQHREPVRLLWGLLLGSMGGLLWFAINQDSWPVLLALFSSPGRVLFHAGKPILTGAFLGFTVERVADRRRWWTLALDAPVFTLLLLGHYNLILKYPQLILTQAAPTRASAPAPRVTASRLVIPASPNPVPIALSTMALQAALWAGAGTSRRLRLMRLFRRQAA